MKKTLTIQRSLLNEAIVSYFDENLDYTEYRREVRGRFVYYQYFEFDHKFTCEGKEYSAFIQFSIEDGRFNCDDKNDITVTDKNGLEYSVGKDNERTEYNELIIKTRTQNPKKPTIHEDISNLLERAEIKWRES